MAWLALQLYIIYEFNSRKLKYVKCVDERKGNEMMSKKRAREFLSLSVRAAVQIANPHSLFSIISICPSTSFILILHPHPSSVSFSVPFK